MAGGSAAGRIAHATALLSFLLVMAGSEAASASPWSHPQTAFPQRSEGKGDHRKLGPRQLGEGERQECDLCAENWLLVISEFRTGSTTSLAMFNSVPGFEISGEHFGILKEQEAIARKAWDSQHRPGAAFNGAKHGFDRQHYHCIVQETMRSVILGKDRDRIGDRTAVLGFKEIRYTDLRTLRFIASAFPCARFLFTFREDAAAPINAKGFNVEARGDQIRNRWSEWTQLVHMIHNALPSTTWLLPLETSTVETFRGVLRDLGVRGCQYRYLLHENADGGNQHDDGLTGVMEGECDHSALDFQLSASAVARNEQAWHQVEEDVREMCHSTGSMCRKISPEYDLTRWTAATSNAAKKAKKRSAAATVTIHF
eukprot:CAMPEP_0117679990 /NCGR_PEP_ID=MMETSP0804-20121206/18100_1 /TAXON_ID=1074897 /ORGANISM="Tetraselmis astigmatica, Strain CCMP880" /LENGTH=369 /DNA_ID=CAMNT_0005489431 /DNA_START=646 /DNA_END=1755 /DNA_ORIENTATION=-